MLTWLRIYAGVCLYRLARSIRGKHAAVGVRESERSFPVHSEPHRSEWS